MAVSTNRNDWRDGATAEQVVTVEHLYRNHQSLPYISPERDLAGVACRGGVVLVEDRSEVGT